MSEKPKFVYTTGKEDDTGWASPERFTRHVHKELGVELPVGRGRTAWYQKLKEEMTAQRWSWDDMAKAVRYCKAHKIHPRKPYGVLYYVYKAKVWEEEHDDWELQGKVADALAVETDETWRRRLSLAKGGALSKVYEQWRQERA